MLRISLLLVFMLFISVKSASEDEIPCREEENACGIWLPSEKPTFPENAEQLKHICKIGISYLTCIDDAHKSCESPNIFRKSYYEKSLATVHALCDEDSKLHIRIVEHIGCIRDTILNFNVSCRELAKDIRNSAGYRIDLEDEEYYKFGCLHLLMEQSCILKNIGQSCGVAAEETVLDALIEIYEYTDLCLESSLKEAADLVGVLEIDRELKLRVENILNKISLL